MCKDAPTPDPAIGEAARMNAEVAKEALGWYKDLYSNELLPMQKEQQALGRNLIDRYLASMDEQSEFAKEQKEYYDQTFKPLEQQVARDAMDYDSAANIERRSGIAAANVAQQFSNAQQESARNLSRYGLNPNSSAFAATNEKLMREKALQTAGAQTGAAFDTMDRGIALRAGAANFGRNMPNTAAAYYGNANNAGGQAFGTSSGMQQSAANNAGVMGQGFNSFYQGNTAAGNLYLGDFNARMRGFEAQSAMTGDLFKAAGTAAGAFFSSKDYKEDKKAIGKGKALKAVEKMDVESWKYKDGVEDGKRHVGPYAEDFKRETGMGTGKAINVQDAIGITMKAVQDLSEEVKGLKRIQKKADGGKVHRGAGGVRGPGGPVDDKIPAMLSNGEYVLPADTVKAIGKGKLDKLVKSTHTPAAVQRQAMKKGK